MSPAGTAYFAVRRARGPGWDPARLMREQRLWKQHAEFMNALAEDGFVVLGGPVGDGAETLLVIDAPSEQSLRARLSVDPWTRAGILEIARVEPWTILLDGRAP